MLYDVEESRQMDSRLVRLQNHLRLHYSLHPLVDVELCGAQVSGEVVGSLEEFESEGAGHGLQPEYEATVDVVVNQTARLRLQPHSLSF